MKKILVLLSVICIISSTISCGSTKSKEYTSNTFEEVLNAPEKSQTRTESDEVRKNVSIITQDDDQSIEIVPGTIFDTNLIPLVYSEFTDQSNFIRKISPEYSECFSNILSEFSCGLDSQPKYREALLTQNPTSKGEHLSGQSVITTYNAKIQKSVYEYCSELNINGSVVIMRTDGSIAGEISVPGYDANEYLETLIKGEEYPLVNDGNMRNKAEEKRAPGSAFKMISASIAKLEGIKGDTGETGVFNDEGFWDTSDGFRVKDWYYSDEVGFSSGYGPTVRNIRNAFILSSNVVFAKVFVSLGTSRIDSLTKKYFCFGVPIDLDFTTINYSNQLGLNSDKELALTGFGQGKCSTTPLYLTMLTREVIYGSMVKATTLHKLCDTFFPERVLSKGSSTPCEVIADTRGVTLKEEMHEIANGLDFSLEGYTLYCKTGTAEVEGNDDTLYIAAYLEADRNFSPSDIYENYRDYGDRNGSYFIVLQIRNPKEIKFNWKDPNNIYASHMGPILNNIAYLITSND